MRKSNKNKNVETVVEKIDAVETPQTETVEIAENPIDAIVTECVKHIAKKSPANMAELLQKRSEIVANTNWNNAKMIIENSGGIDCAIEMFSTIVAKSENENARNIAQSNLDIVNSYVEFTSKLDAVNADIENAKYFTRAIIAELYNSIGETTIHKTHGRKTKHSNVNGSKTHSGYIGKVYKMVNGKKIDVIHPVSELNEWPSMAEAKRVILKTNCPMNAASIHSSLGNYVENGVKIPHIYEEATQSPE